MNLTISEISKRVNRTRGVIRNYLNDRSHISFPVPRHCFSPFE
ncbi:hypothetical protein ACDT12_13500 [Staphylococcus aureus]